MFFLIGLGLGDCKDITVKGLEIIKRCDRVYLEAYTSILTVGTEAMEEFYGRRLITADRDLVEQGADEILQGAENSDVALLVVGDPFGATTHTDLVLRAKEKGIKYQLYSFGETVSIPYWSETWQPDSFFEKIEANYSRGLHTLCLLDIRVKEPTPESLVKKKKEYQPPRFMSVSEASDQLLQIISKKQSSLLTPNALCIGLARIGSENQEIVAAPIQRMQQTDLGGPLHSLVIPAAKLHPLEEEYVRQFVR